MEPQMQHTIDGRALAVLDRLQAAGFAAYIVGGAVRDILMKKPASDFDIATSALPTQVQAVFADKNVVETGLAHGTLTVIYDGLPTEVTTFRRDGDYLDARHPEQVSFTTNIADDLARRDFTINAMALDAAGSIIDPYGGRDDLAAGILRAVGEPAVRLGEDALRIMRALRFAATLGFTIEPGLATALHEQRDLLARIAPERIMLELQKLLLGGNVTAILLEYPDVLGVFIPEVAPTVGFDQCTSSHCYDVWEHSAQAVALAPRDVLTRLTLLFHDLGKPECFSTDERGRGHFYGHDEAGERIARERLTALHCSNDTIETVSTLISRHGVRLEPHTAKRWLNRLGERRLLMLLNIKRADISAHSKESMEVFLANIDAVEAAVDEAIAQEQCFQLRDLAINGRDVLELGVAQGPQIGALLNTALELVLDDKLPNERQALLQWLSDRV
jgi:tRNA nucleotidyltransferase (CCA-adding enzyme)